MVSRVRAALVILHGAGAILALACGGCHTHPNRSCHQPCLTCMPDPEFYGYQATCWQAWPEEWLNCPPPGLCQLNQPAVVPESVPAPKSETDESQPDGSEPNSTSDPGEFMPDSDGEELMPDDDELIPDNDEPKSKPDEDTTSLKQRPKQQNARKVLRPQMNSAVVRHVGHTALTVDKSTVSPDDKAKQAVPPTTSRRTPQASIHKAGARTAKNSAVVRHEGQASWASDMPSDLPDEIPSAHENTAFKQTTSRPSGKIAENERTAGTLRSSKTSPSRLMPSAVVSAAPRVNATPTSAGMRKVRSSATTEPDYPYVFAHD